LSTKGGTLIIEERKKQKKSEKISIFYRFEYLISTLDSDLKWGPSFKPSMRNGNLSKRISTY
jgi:hypothetical protein